MGVFMASTFGAELDLICNSNSFKSVDDLAKTFKTLRKRYQTDLNIDWDDVDRRLKELLPKSSTKEDFLGIIHCFSGPLFQNVANTEHFMGNEMEAIFFRIFSSICSTKITQVDYFLLSTRCKTF